MQKSKYNPSNCTSLMTDQDSTTPNWSIPPSAPTLVPGQVHLWRVALDQSLERFKGITASLSPDELAQASKFAFEIHRRRYLISHSFLRSVLASYLGCPLQAIQYSLGLHGKPALTADSNKAGNPPGNLTDLHFNMAHSHELAILGVALGGEIGVDVEHHRRSVNYEKLAAYSFSPRESAVLLALPKEQREIAFYNAWTRKEAYLKALGDGLARPLDSFDVSLAPGEAPRLLHVDQSPDEPGRWSFCSFIPQPNYTAAVAIEEQGPFSISFIDWA